MLQGLDFDESALDSVVCFPFVRQSVCFEIRRIRSLVRLVGPRGSWDGHVFVRSFEVRDLQEFLRITKIRLRLRSVRKPMAPREWQTGN